MTISILFDLFASFIFCVQIMNYLSDYPEDYIKYALYAKMLRFLVLMLMFVAALDKPNNNSFTDHYR